MNNRHLVAITGGILLVGIGSYAACGMEVGAGGDELGAVAPDPGTAPPMERIDAGTDDLTMPEANTQEPPSMPERAAQQCSAETCQADETCCVVDGHCYPSSCADCCPAQDTLPAPTVAGIDLEDPDTGNPAGPAPEPVVTPPGGGPGQPPGTGPGPMPPGPNE